MKRIYKIVSDFWAMRRQEYDAFMSVLVSILAVNPSAVVEMLNGHTLKPVAVSPMSGNIVDKWDVDDANIPENSVLVLPLRDVLTANTCERIAYYIASAQVNDKICGIVLDIDGPGGTTSHLEAAAKAVKECTKPIATVVTGAMHSAHFWLGTCAQRTFIETPMCEVGCVGVLIRYQDMSGLFEKLGIKTTEIYAAGSDLKNAEVRELLAGDDSLLRARADFLNGLFCDTVAKNLGIDYDKELPIFRGQTYFADEALKLGYIDQWGGVDDAVRWVLARATAEKANKLF